MKERKDREEKRQSSQYSSGLLLRPSEPSRYSPRVAYRCTRARWHADTQSRTTARDTFCSRVRSLLSVLSCALQETLKEMNFGLVRRVVWVEGKSMVVQVYLTRRRTKQKEALAQIDTQV